jgi:hypothetical protein
MRYIKLFESFTDYITSEESLKRIDFPDEEFDELMESSSIEEVTDKDVKFCESQLLEVFKETDIKFTHKKTKRFSQDDVESCITFDLLREVDSYKWNLDGFFIVFYKYSDDYWIIETYLGEINWNFPGGSDYQFWIADYYEGIKEWTKMMKLHFSLYYNNSIYIIRKK